MSTNKYIKYVLKLEFCINILFILVQLPLVYSQYQTLWYYKVFL